MSVAKIYKEDKHLQKRVAEYYLQISKPTTKETAEHFNTTVQNIQYALRSFLPKDVKDFEEGLRTSRQKQLNNPMKGKFGKAHHNYKGDCADGKGYITVAKPQWFTGHKGNRVFKHHVVICEALGLTEIPRGWHIHHIDENKTNNSLENLALLTVKAHNRIHGARPELSQLKGWERYEYMISKSKQTIAT